MFYERHRLQICQRQTSTYQSVQKQRGYPCDDAYDRERHTKVLTQVGCVQVSHLVCDKGVPPQAPPCNELTCKSESSRLPVMLGSHNTSNATNSPATHRSSCLYPIRASSASSSSAAVAVTTTVVFSKVASGSFGMSSVYSIEIPRNQLLVCRRMLRIASR